jgi:hypothetical protein
MQQGGGSGKPSRPTKLRRTSSTRGDHLRENRPASTEERLPGLFDTLAAFVDRSVQAPFKRLGTAVGSSPWRVIALSVLITALCASGISQIVTESRPDKLWNPSEVPGQKLKEKFEVHATGQPTTIPPSPAPSQPPPPTTTRCL